MVTFWRSALLETPTLTGTYLSRTLRRCRPGTSPPNLRVAVSTSLGSQVKLRECAGRSVAFIVVPRGPKRLRTRQPLSSYRTRPETPYGKPIGLMLMGYWQMALRKVISSPSMAILSPKSRTARVCLLCATMASSTRMHLLRPAYWAISLNLCSPQMSLTLTPRRRIPHYITTGDIDSQCRETPGLPESQESLRPQWDPSPHSPSLIIRDCTSPYHYIQTVHPVWEPTIPVEESLDHPCFQERWKISTI